MDPPGSRLAPHRASGRMDAPIHLATMGFLLRKIAASVGLIASREMKACFIRVAIAYYPISLPQSPRHF